MKKKHLIMIMVGMFVCGLLISSYMLKNGLAKADSASVTEVQIDDGFVVLLENNARGIDNFNNQEQTGITEAPVEVTNTTGNVNESSAEVISTTEVVNETPVVEATEVPAQAPVQGITTAENPVSIKYYDTYEDFAPAEHDKNYGAAQGFDISGGIAYYAKIDNASNDIDRQARIYAYDMKTRKTSYVYENNPSDTTFKIGHANCICVKDNYMYIATMLDNGPSIYRYTITNSNGRIILTDLQKYTVYSHDKTRTTGIKITGLHYASDLNAFFVKLGIHVYYGNFEGNEFKWTKHFKVDTDLSFNTGSGTVKLNANEYTHQGMFYKNGALYFPMTNSDTWNESIVVRYPVSVNMAAESTIAEDPNTFVRITSQKYSKLIEIECVGEYNGQMYAFNNNTTSGGVTEDKIIKIKGFTY